MEAIEQLNAYHKELVRRLEQGEKIDDVFEERVTFYLENKTEEMHKLLTEHVMIEKKINTLKMDGIEEYLITMNNQQKIANKFEEKKW